MKLFITRPREDALPLAEKLRKAGLRVIISPVLEIVPRPDVTIPSTKYQAICVTSANGVRCLQGDIDASTPVLAVGTQSAEAAKVRGFLNVTARGGDVHGLADYIRAHLSPGGAPLLYISGAETSGDLQGQLSAAGFSVTRLITYDAVAQRLDGLTTDLQAGDRVLLYSPRSAKLWASEIVRQNLQTVAQHVTHYCLSQQVAAALPPQFPAMAAPRPEESALLALLDLAGEAE
jgi:uroporphyrinogen-III synthase